jgi:dTDP-4-amino-4,6-dideoxygalactose transaminase
MVPFNKPYLTGKEVHYMYDAIYLGKLSGNGKYTKKCQEYFEETYGFKKTLLTSSCTDALEMCAILLNIKDGDEIIVPSFTFVSTALAFVRHGAKIIFADSLPDHPNMDVSKIESLITPKTRLIVPVHYAGIPVDMDPLMALANKYNLYVVEDAAQAIDSFYKGKALGTFGHLSAFSFHETKNIISGEGGMLAINDIQFIKRAEIIWEKGTNRASFFRGETDKYSWVDTGSSFLPSESMAAFLFAQIEQIKNIQQKRKLLWDTYYSGLSLLKNRIILPNVPIYASNNSHIFYILLCDINQRQLLIQYLKQYNIHATFHYLSLHKSPYYLNNNLERPELLFSDKYSDCLLRLPLFYDLSVENVNMIVSKIIDFFKTHSKSDY